jgi:hypothetical protein
MRGKSRFLTPSRLARKLKHELSFDSDISAAEERIAKRMGFPDYHIMKESIDKVSGLYGKAHEIKRAYQMTLSSAKDAAARLEGFISYADALVSILENPVERRKASLKIRFSERILASKDAQRPTTESNIRLRRSFGDIRSGFPLLNNALIPINRMAMRIVYRPRSE